MSKVYLICGKICSGKTTYSKKLCEENNAILLSVDEIMLSLFDQCCGRKLHMEYEKRIKEYLFTKSLEIIEKGFDAFIYESPLDKMNAQIAAGEKPNINLYFAGKNAIKDFVSEQDLIITLCDVMTGRPSFGMSKGGGEIPWYVFETPVVAISVNAPTMLADIPQVRTYINAYDSKPSTLDALVDNLLIGPDAFKGQDPIDSFCGMWDTKI